MCSWISYSWDPLTEEAESPFHRRRPKTTCFCHFPFNQSVSTRKFLLNFTFNGPNFVLELVRWMRILQIMYFLAGWGEEGCEEENNEPIPEKYKNRAEIGTRLAPRSAEYKEELYIRHSWLLPAMLFYPQTHLSHFSFFCDLNILHKKCTNWGIIIWRHNTVNHIFWAKNHMFNHITQIQCVQKCTFCAKIYSVLG